MHRQERWSLLLLYIILQAVLLPAAQKDKTTSSDRNTVEGAKLFQYHCAACHGADGRGHGPASGSLKHSVPNLTRISQGSGGTFPHQRVRAIIDGKGPRMTAHGDREMPVWGPIFHEVEADQDWGEVRLDAITRYLESIQQK
jgi:mono/diheme cytochrome c family protein